MPVSHSSDGIAEARMALERRDYARAESLCQKILARRPYDLEAKSVRIGVLTATGRATEAVNAAVEALRLAPKSIELNYRYGHALLDAGEREQGGKVLVDALRLRVESKQDMASRGIVLATLGDFLQAIDCFTKALTNDPGDTVILKQLDRASRTLGLLEPAWQAIQRALQLRPDDPSLLSMAGNILMKRGQFREATRYLRDAMSTSAQTLDGTNHLLGLNYNPDATPAEIFAEHKAWGEHLMQGLPREFTFANPRDPEKKLRIGYVSADLKRHAVAQFLRPILANHDPSQFETFIYSGLRREDEISALIRSQVGHWKTVHALRDEPLAELIRQDGIDILIDLTGHTGGNRLPVFALKPAPLQITYLGYCATTGLPTMDYCITDTLLDLPGDEAYYTEKLLRLPGCFCAFWPPTDPKEQQIVPGMSGELPISELPALKNGHITFGSFHGLMKLNEAVLELWSKVLHAIPDSRLLLFRNTLHPPEQARLLAALEALGIASTRLEFECAWPEGRHYMTRYNQIDLHLDTFPWSGHTTTCEALWMGIPTLTLLGDRHAARMSATVLHAAGLPDFIASTSEQFVQLAQQWAQRLPELAQLRQTLRERMLHSQLCDGKQFTHQLEAAYRDLWRGWCAKESA